MAIQFTNEAIDMSNYSNLSVAVSAAVAVMDDDEFASITPNAARGLAARMRRVFPVSDQVEDLIVSRALADLLTTGAINHGSAIQV